MDVGDVVVDEQVGVEAVLVGCVDRRGEGEDDVVEALHPGGNAERIRVRRQCGGGAVHPPPRALPRIVRPRLRHCEAQDQDRSYARCGHGATLLVVSHDLYQA